MQLTNTNQTIDINLYNNEVATIYVNEGGYYNFYVTSGYDTSEGDKLYKSLDSIFRKLKDYEKMCKDE